MIKIDPARVSRGIFTLEGALRLRDATFDDVEERTSGASVFYVARATVHGGGKIEVMGDTPWDAAERLLTHAVRSQ